MRPPRNGEVSAPPEENVATGVSDDTGGDVAFVLAEVLDRDVAGNRFAADFPADGPPSLPFNLDEALHRSRERIALLVLWIFIGVLGAGLVLFSTVRWTKLTAEEVRDIFINVFTPMIGLVSGVLAFYYGTERPQGKG